MNRKILLWVLGCLLATSASADDRQFVQFPEMMRGHMMMNMRDHMSALAEAQSLVAAEEWDRASDVIERRVGMSSMESHGASHMAPLMPPAMRALGTEMHREASRLSRTLSEADLQKAMAGFAALTKRCIACHAGFRVH